MPGEVLTRRPVPGSPDKVISLKGGRAGPVCQKLNYSNLTIILRKGILRDSRRFLSSGSKPPKKRKTTTKIKAPSPAAIKVTGQLTGKARIAPVNGTPKAREAFRTFQKN